MIKAIVFDFDGVLADTEPLHFRAYEEVLAGVGTTLTRDEYYGQLVGYNDEDCFRLIAQSRGWERNESRIASLVADKGRVFEQIILDTDTLYTGAAACVERAWTSNPTHVIVPDKAGPPHRSGVSRSLLSGQTNPREERPAPTTAGQPHGLPAIGSSASTSSASTSAASARSTAARCRRAIRDGPSRTTSIRT